MGIKPDHWIKKMALEHRLIEPFEPEQVKSGVISYGVSSYGYDIRVSDEFRIFTNVNNTVVDPKHFDSRSFVEFKGDICTIPPNSFVLARTIEYFRIPRDVLTICIGKSTYARCFRGDTRVALVDGTVPTLEEMAKRAEKGEMFWGYSLGKDGRTMVTLLESPRYIGRDKLLEVKLDNQQTIFCTPDHQFMLRDGQWLEADRLRPGQALMPLYRNKHQGYEMVYQPSSGHLYPTYCLADEWNLRHKIYSKRFGSTRQYLDGNKTNNNPWNIVRTAQSRSSLLPVLQSGQGRNHKVTSVQPLAGEHDVYCVTVPEAGNFALEAGVFVHNCGIIVNVTPFEPEWEGFVTIEISNTTPLPARIYANEGIAQVIFLQADEECELSYADKKGKYQKQSGITLPKVAPSSKKAD